MSSPPPRPLAAAFTPAAGVGASTPASCPRLAVQEGGGLGGRRRPLLRAEGGSGAAAAAGAQTWSRSAGARGSSRAEPRRAGQGRAEQRRGGGLNEGGAGAGRGEGRQAAHARTCHRPHRTAPAAARSAPEPRQRGRNSRSGTSPGTRRQQRRWGGGGAERDFLFDSWNPASVESGWRSKPTVSLHTSFLTCPFSLLGSDPRHPFPSRLHWPRSLEVRLSLSKKIKKKSIARFSAA
ncbi:uncharacterized protein [Notamacropus eugenii]|uniref:uncharacterized protein n=1 Tax=Notamacropus eugenii TaxID=9315 RepID=UPI003B684D71